MKKIFAIFFTLCSFTAFSQSPNYDQFEKEYAKGNIEVAINYLKKALKNEEKHKGLLYAWLGDAYLKQKKFKASADCYVKVVEHTDELQNNGLIYFSIGTNYYFAQEYKKAITYLEKSLEAGHKDSGIANNLGWCYAETKKYSKAIEYFEMAYNEDPKLINNINNLGYAYYLNGELNKAEKLILKAQKIDANNSFVYRNLGLIALKRKQKNKACTYLDKAIEKGIINEWGEHYIKELVLYCKK
ncbi:exported hypothetical protein [Tenacibaculum sp. 190524A05c]|uniref:tetratricopeptide repeat protein n=1 Tax=Tenacibaculum platacis TaxID=3137852 RepID=UPI0031FB36B3